MLPCPAGWEGLLEAEEWETLKVLLQQDEVMGVWEARSCLPLPFSSLGNRDQLELEGGKTSHPV